MKLRVLRAAILLSSLPACSGGEAATGGSGKVVDSSSGTVALGLDARSAYRATGGSGGTLTGTISLQGEARDSMVATGKDAKVCGDSAAVRQSNANGTALGNALVWIDGIQAGKPLPEERRETITMERCHFEPRVLAVVAGSTINVFSRDRVAHTARFYREGAGEPVAFARTVDEGQVVPSEQIASAPGIVEARCTLHPWARGYVAVFEHPYFAVTDASGKFSIAGLPGGTYTVKVWHEGLEKPVEQRVTLAGGTGQLDVAVALR